MTNHLDPRSFTPPYKNLRDVLPFDRFAYVSSLQALRDVGGVSTLTSTEVETNTLPDKDGDFSSWEPEVRALLVVSEFMGALRFTKDEANVELVDEAGKAIEKMVCVPPPAAHTLPGNLLGLQGVLDARTLREARLAQIVAQMGDVEQMLLESIGLTVPRFPFTFELMTVGSQLAEIISHRFKHVLNLPRPHKLDRSVAPMIPVPGHASYPGGHAIQSQVAAGLLLFVASVGGLKVPDKFLLLPREISFNRVVAGLHYPLDGEEGLRLGSQLLKWLISSLLFSIESAKLDPYEVRLKELGWLPIPFPSTKKLPLFGQHGLLALKEF